MLTGPSLSSRSTIACRMLNLASGVQERGFADVVYLDARTDTYLEEVSSCNVFIVKGKTVKTPSLTVQPLVIQVLRAWAWPCQGVQQLPT